MTTIAACACVQMFIYPDLCRFHHYWLCRIKHACHVRGCTEILNPWCMWCRIKCWTYACFIIIMSEFLFCLKGRETYWDFPSIITQMIGWFQIRICRHFTTTLGFPYSRKGLWLVNSATHLRKLLIGQFCHLPPGSLWLVNSATYLEAFPDVITVQNFQI